MIVALANVAAAAYDLDLVKPAYSKSPYYSDGRIQIVFALRETSNGRDQEGIAFTIRNLTNREIEIDWNRSSMWLPTGQMSGVIHEGVRFIQSNTYLPPTVIPAGRTLSDFVIPTRNITFSVTGWQVRSLNLRSGSQLGLYLFIQGSSLPGGGYDFALQAASAAEVSTAETSVNRWWWLLAAVGLVYAKILL